MYGNGEIVTSARRLVTTAARSAPRPSVAGAMAALNMSPRRAATCPSTTAHLRPIGDKVNMGEKLKPKSLNQVDSLQEYGDGGRRK
jgi:hypothetical protein